MLVYIAFHLINSSTLQESTSVDTIIRTSASAIFGYFISNNFIRSGVGSALGDTSLSNQVNSSIGKNATDEISEQDSVKDLSAISPVRCKKLQIIVVSSIGFLALLLLLISRNYNVTTPEFSATVSQLRDFLSASIGFLASCGKPK